MSCTSATSQNKSSDMQNNTEILASESQGGTDMPGFKMIKTEQELKNAVRGSFGLVEVGKEPDITYPQFPKDKKIIQYNLGMFRSGDHKITQIKSLSIQNDVLYVEVPQYESGGLEIQAISRPWFIFAVPSDYKFNSVELKYSK